MSDDQPDPPDQDQLDQLGQHNQLNQPHPSQSEAQLDSHLLLPVSSGINSSGPGHIDPEYLTLYALQFIEGEQAAAIAAHLALCTACHDELALIHGDLAATALSTELESPTPAARQRFLAQVAQEKQAAHENQIAQENKVVPIAQSNKQAQSPAESAQPALASFGRKGSILNPIEEERPKRRVGLGIFAGLGWAAAAGLAFFAFTLYKDSASLRGTIASRAGEVERLNAEAASSHQLLEALTDPKAVRVALTAKPQPKPSPIGGVTYNPEKGTLVFLASNLDPLQLYKVYELWIIPADGSAPIPVGTFHSDDSGNASLIMPDLPKGIVAKSFGVTVEDDGGSQTPTLPIVLAGGLG
jgi:hypothetical protein